MTTTTSEPPTDSIFSAMSDQSLSAPPAPMLGMLVDRTSFDETDDFGISEIASMTDDYIAGPPVKMKDGTIRRRLRWRPKSMAKKRRTPVIPRSSSNASVMSTSNLSQTSKQSKRSMHSFASTETATVNNTTKKKVPLPLPNYIPENINGGVATIGNEGDWVHARISKNNKNGGKNVESSPPTTLFAAADVEQKKDLKLSSSSKNKASDDSKSSAKAKGGANSKSTAKTKTSGLSGSPRRAGLPPRFQQRSANRNQNDISPVSTPNTAVSLSPSNSSENEEDLIDTEPSPVPVLSGDEVEAERRVDLRIRRVPSTLSTQGIPAKLGDGVEPLSVHELRGPDVEERQDKFKNTQSSKNKFMNASRIPPALKSVLSEGITGRTKHKSDKASPRPGKMVAPSSPASMPDRSSITGVALSPQSRHSADEIRFSMSTASRAEEFAANAQARSPASRKATKTERCSHKAQTVPVDVDNGTFLEAEKNLKAIHEMASEHLQQGEYTEALEVFEEILRGQLTRYGEDHYRVGTALHNIGIVHMRRGDYPKAVEVYKEAVRVRKKALEPHHSDVAVSLAQLGVAYMESNKHRKAIGAFREALKIRRKCLGNQHPKVAKILNNIGCSLFELDELEVAKVAFEEALEIQRNLLRDPPENEGLVSESSLLSIASTQSNIASIKLYCGQYDEACVDLEEALLIQQCVLGDDHPLALRTQESLAWMEKSRDGTDAVTVNLLSKLTGTLSSSSKDDEGRALSVFGSLEQRLRKVYSGLDIACTGWDGSDNEELSTN